MIACCRTDRQRWCCFRIILMCVKRQSLKCETMITMISVIRMHQCLRRFSSRNHTCHGTLQLTKTFRSTTFAIPVATDVQAIQTLGFPSTFPCSTTRRSFPKSPTERQCPGLLSRSSPAYQRYPPKVFRYIRDTSQNKSASAFPRSPAKVICEHSLANLKWHHPKRNLFRLLLPVDALPRRRFPKPLERTGSQSKCR